MNTCARVSAPATVRSCPSHKRSMHPSGRTRFSPPVATDVHTNPPGTRLGRSRYIRQFCRTVSVSEVVGTASPRFSGDEEHGMRIRVFNHLTLDGVMQAPAAPDEDTRDGFDRGGWAAGDEDSVMNAKTGESMSSSDGLLLGRRTYEHVLGYWNTQPDSPFTPVLNDAPKYVASTTLRDPMPWPNSMLLGGDVPSAVAALRQQGDGNLTALGSGDLLHTLMAHDLVDEYVLMIHPVVVGSGRRLFSDHG